MFIVGTDTGIGKTVVSAGIVCHLKSIGCNTVYYKPVSSNTSDNISGDAHFVHAFSGIKTVVSYAFKTAVSPHLAAQQEGITIDIEKICETFHHLQSRYDYIICEGAGGLAVPLLSDGSVLIRDLVKMFNIPILIVAQANVGTLNHTTLTVEYAQNAGLDIEGIIINNYDENILAHKDNLKMISKLTNVPILATVPKIDGIDVDNYSFGTLEKDFPTLETLWTNNKKKI